MGRKEFYTIQRKGVYYFKLPHEQTYHSTESRDYDEAVKIINDVIYGRTKNTENRVLEDFAKTFFIWGECQFVKRRISMGKRFSRQQAVDRRGHLENHIFPKFGKRYLSSLKPAEIEDWLLEKEDIANQTKNHILSTFRLVLQEAYRREIIELNPYKKFDSFAVNHKHRDIYHQDELNRLFPLPGNDFNAVWDNYMVGVMCLLILTTGMRHGEARALQWKDIHSLEDFKYAAINKSVKGNGSIGTTKNGKARIAILIDPIIPFLIRLKKQSAFVQPEDYLFTINGTKPFFTNYSYKYYNKALTKAGISRENRKLDIHSFRHTFVTVHRIDRLDEKALEMLVGHQDIKVTDIYDHRQLEDNIQMLLPEKNSLQKSWEKILHVDPFL